MGPRRWSRGMVAGQPFDAHPHPASMGPRRWSRGMDEIIGWHWFPSMGFNGATAVEPWNGRLRKACSPASGRFNGATAVEPWNGRWSTLRRSPSSRFNGATAVEPWNGRNHRVALVSLYGLQWGHGGGAVEWPPEESL